MSQRFVIEADNTKYPAAVVRAAIEAAERYDVLQRPTQVTFVPAHDFGDGRFVVRVTVDGTATIVHDHFRSDGTPIARGTSRVLRAGETSKSPVLVSFSPRLSISSR